MRVLRCLITAPTFPVAIIYRPSLHLLNTESALRLTRAGAHLFGTLNAPPLKTFVELAEDAAQAVARRNVARGDLDRPLDDHFRIGERDLLDPAALLHLGAGALEELGAVLERLLGHVGADDRPFLEEQTVTRVRHDALVELLDLAKLGLVNLDVAHSRQGKERGKLYIGSSGRRSAGFLGAVRRVVRVARAPTGRERRLKTGERDGPAGLNLGPRVVTVEEDRREPGPGRRPCVAPE